MTKTRVGLIYGGRSGEHEVSVLSANFIMQAIDRDKYEILPIGITKDGCWIPGQSPSALVESKNLQVRLLNDGDRNKNEIFAMLANDQGKLLAGLGKKVDVAFPIVHGPFGEDGTIQGLLELAGIPYVGGGVAASAVGMDKVLMKLVFQQKGLPVGDYLYYLRKDLNSCNEAIISEIEQQLELPCFVKPANLGSSVGISKAHNRDELNRALHFAAEFDRKIIVEKMLNGREIECAVLGNDEPIASVPGEIMPCAEFYDYEAKYVLNDSKLEIPAALSRKTTSKVRNLAIQAFKAIDCSGLGRVDFFVDEQTDTVLVNEINTIPGFTGISMYPKLWEASGVSNTDLIDRLLQLALERHRDKMSNRVS
jgi:D-alanine-D-alanine ligase